VPIYQTATFATADAAELADVSTGARSGFTYSRLDNPTVRALGDAFAELHGADDGLGVASGMAAIHLAFLSLLRAGDRLVIGDVGYGQTRVQAHSTFERLGVEVVHVDTTDIDAVAAVLAARRTQVLHVETIANPTAVVADLAALADVAHRNGAVLTVDNTFASPAVCRPLEHGADLVVESATKYLAGHSDVMAGVVAGSAERMRVVRALQVDTGATLAPFSAFLVLRGIATFPVRVERQSRTAVALAGWLERQPAVNAVIAPGLPSHPQASVVARQLDSGGAMFSVDLAGGRDAGPAFIDALEIPERTASLGSVHTMVVHPPTTSHRALDDAALAAAGITPGLLRVSVGLEDEADLLADFASALEAVERTVSGRERTGDAEPGAVPAGAR